MKQLQKYQCEICGTEYAEKKVAEMCEKNHKKPLEIWGTRDLPKSMNGAGYPISIEVRMSDGVIITYKR